MEHFRDKFNHSYTYLFALKAKTYPEGEINTVTVYPEIDINCLNRLQCTNNKVSKPNIFGLTEVVLVEMLPFRWQCTK